MTQFYSTRQVAGILGIKPDTLQKAIWSRRATPPEKSPSGQYLWTDADIERASWALLRRSADKVLKEQSKRVRT